MDILNWLARNAEWVFSGLGATIVVAVFSWMGKSSSAPKSSSSATTNNNQTVNVNVAQAPPVALENPGKVRSREAVSILFIDDDVKFKVINILKNNGWTNTKIIKDVRSLNQPELVSADIFFVDIQGVGVSLNFKDQGLGLVLALRNTYPRKKIVIYSAEHANAFHAAFGQANERLSKDADPYEFIAAVERLSE